MLSIKFSNSISSFYVFPFILVLWRVRGQKEDMEEEKVGGTSVLNKQDIYTKLRVLVQQIEVPIWNSQVQLQGGSLPKSK